MIEMASDLDHLRKQQAEELAALKAAQKEEREMRKAQKSIKKSRAKQARTRARKAAKEAYPESNLILVWNGRPIAVREVERPAQIVRADNILPRNVQPVRSDNILPKANYNILASQNARCSCGSCGTGGCRHGDVCNSVCRDCLYKPYRDGVLSPASGPRRDYWTLSIDQRRKILEMDGWTAMPRNMGGDEFHMMKNGRCDHINHALEVMINSGVDIFTYLDEGDLKPNCERLAERHAKKPMASQNARPVGLDTILRYGTYAGGITHPDGDIVQFVLNDGSKWQIYLNQSFGDKAPSNTEIIRTAYRVERMAEGTNRKPAASKNLRPRKAPAKKPAAKKATAGRKTR